MCVLLPTPFQALGTAREREGDIYIYIYRYTYTHIPRHVNPRILHSCSTAQNDSRDYGSGLATSEFSKSVPVPELSSKPPLNSQNSRP